MSEQEQIKYWILPVPPVPGEPYRIPATTEFLEHIHSGLEHPAIIQDKTQWPFKTIATGVGKILAWDKTAGSFTAIFTPDGGSGADD